MNSEWWMVKRVHYLLWAVAGWPVLAWWVRRASNADDALAAGAALAGAALVVASQRGPTARARDGWLAAAAAMALYGAAAVAGLPATLLGVPLLAGLLLTPGPWRRGPLPDPAVAGLLVLGLPAVMMLELYFGYPLRLAASTGVEVLLAAAGVPVAREGVLLTLPGQPVWVDAPCSGVRMLWGGLWLTLVFSGFASLNWWRTLAAGLIAAGVVTVANGLRVTALVFAAAGVLPSGGVFHEGIGLASFAMGVAGIAMAVRQLRPKAGSGIGRLSASANTKEEDHGCLTASPSGEGCTHPSSCGGACRCEVGPPVLSPARAMRGRSLYLMVCGAVTALSFLVSGETNAVDTADAAFSGWPTVFEGQSLQEGPLLPHEMAFAARFPGRVGRFACGGWTVIIRWVTRPSHRVHGAADCLRSAGWRITPLPLFSS